MIIIGEKINATLDAVKTIILNRDTQSLLDPILHFGASGQGILHTSAHC